MVCVAVCVVINLRFLGLKSHNILDMEGEYSEMCDVEKDYPCICCSGAYESFDSIVSVMEEKQKVKITEKIEEKVKRIKATKGPASQEQIKRRFKEQIQKEEAEEAAFLRRTGVLEKSPNGKLMKLKQICSKVAL